MNQNDLITPRHHLQPGSQAIATSRLGSSAPIQARTVIYPDDPFKASRRPLSSITAIFFHESVTHDADVLEDGDESPPDATERILFRRGLGVHFMSGLDDDGRGVITQHNPLDEAPAHIGRWNKASIGIEVVTPYYPSGSKALKPWRDVIRAPWAHRGFYVLPLPEQMEQVFLLWASLIDAFPSLSTFPAHDAAAGTFAMAPIKLPPGGGFTAAHHHLGGHADGAWPTLYCFLRSQGRTPADAYSHAANIASGAGSSVRL